MTLRDRANEIKSNIIALFIAIKKPETPCYAKLIAKITIIYALSPIDLIPDFIPVLGYLDDIILLPLLISLSIKLIPKEVMEISLIESKGIWKEGKPQKWSYAIPIIVIWIIILAMILSKIIQ
jgi:uncharacterized membrane protein YkvA (DUF1232 family)